MFSNYNMQMNESRIRVQLKLDTQVESDDYLPCEKHYSAYPQNENSNFIYTRFSNYLCILFQSEIQLNV